MSQISSIQRSSTVRPRAPEPQAGRTRPQSPPGAAFRMADPRSARNLQAPQAPHGVLAPSPNSGGALSGVVLASSTGAPRLSRAAQRVHDDLVDAVDGNFAGYVTDGYEEEFAKALTAASRLSADEQYAIAVALEKATTQGRLRVGDRPFYEKAMSEMMEPPRRRQLVSFVIGAVYDRPALSVEDRIRRFQAIAKQPMGKEGETHGGWSQHHRAQAEALVRSAPARDHRAFILNLKSRGLFNEVRDYLGAETQRYFDGVEITAEYAADDYSVAQRMEKIQTLQAEGARNVPEKMEALYTSAPEASRTEFVTEMEATGKLSFAFGQLSVDSRSEVSEIHSSALYERPDYDAGARVARLQSLLKLTGPIAEQRSSLLATLFASTPEEHAPAYAESLATSGLVERAYEVNSEVTAGFVRDHLTTRPHSPSDRARWLGNVLDRADAAGREHHRTELEALLKAARGTAVADALSEAGLYGRLAQFGRSVNTAIRDQVISLAAEASTASGAAGSFQATKPSFDEELAYIQRLASARGDAFASAAASGMEASGAFPFMGFSYRVGDVNSEGAFASQVARYQTRFDGNHDAFARLYDALPAGDVRETLKEKFGANHVQSRLDSANERVARRLQSYLHFRNRASRFTDAELGDTFERRFERTFDREQQATTIDANFRRVFAEYEDKVELRNYRDELAGWFPSNDLARTYRDEFLEEFSLDMSKSSLKSEFDSWSGRYKALVDALNAFPDTELGTYFRDEFYDEVRRSRFTMSRSSIRSKASTYQSRHRQEVDRRAGLDREFERQHRALRNSVPAGYVRDFEKWWNGQDYDLSTSDIRRAASRIESAYEEVVSHYRTLLSRLPSSGDYRSRFERFWTRNGKDVSKSDLDREFRKLQREHEAEEERRRRAEEERNRRPGSGGSSSGGNQRPGSGSSSGGNKRPGSTNRRPGSNSGNKRPGSSGGNRRPGST